MREIIIIYGKTGTGKSELAKKYICDFERVIIIDPKHEYDGLIFTSLIDLIDYHNEYDPQSFIYVCRFESDLEHEYVFKFAKLIENVLVVVEEAEIYISPFARTSSFLDLCRYGRHHEVSILGIARRNSELSINFRSLVTKLISFKQTEPRDLKAMEELGFHGLDKLGEHDFIEVIP